MSELYRQNCDRFESLIVEWFEADGLRADDRAELTQHLAICSSCRESFELSARMEAALVSRRNDVPALDGFLRLFERGRCWVKLTGPYRITALSDMPYSDVAPLAHRLAEVNASRVLWGTDWPHVMMKKPMPNDGDLSDLIANWLPDANLRRQVLVDNPAELYGFSKGERLQPAAAALNFTN